MVAPVHFLAALIATLCASAVLGAEARPRVVTSFLPLYSWTANVAGDNAHVENLLSARSQPHDYAFKPSDVARLTAADAIVINGQGIEAWLPTFLRMAPTSSNRFTSATAGLDGELIRGGHHHCHGDDHHHGQESEPANEHTWLDPVLAAHAISNILTTLQRLDPRHAGIYASNAQSYVHRLHQLDADIRQRLAGLTNRAIVTYHDAFPYFARRYGLEIAGVVEQVPEVNPTPKYLSRLGQMMRARGIRLICVPPGGGSRLARRIAADLKVELVELDTLESGALSPSAYEERMRQNAAVLQTHLK